MQSYQDFFSSRENKMIQEIVMGSNISVSALVEKLTECENREARVYYLKQQVRFKDLSVHVPSKLAVEFCDKYAKREKWSHERTSQIR